MTHHEDHILPTAPLSPSHPSAENTPLPHRGCVEWVLGTEGPRRAVSENGVDVGCHSLIPLRRPTVESRDEETSPVDEDCSVNYAPSTTASTAENSGRCP